MLFLAALLLFLFGNITASENDLLVKLNHGGSLAGIYLKTESGKPIRSFLGIPYAKPPTGELRFEAPVSFPAWDGIKNATKSGSPCTQTYALHPDDKFIQGTEDCLFVNVYTPPVSRIPPGGLSVMVWIHGGAWLGGSNENTFYGPEYIMEENVILVSINYRVGALGFLSSETLDCPGNFGLKDQVEALRWVKEHISSFGGNPGSVTIFGESAGGASISYLLQSEKPRGLFHKAIQQSGTIFNSWAQPLHKGVAQSRALKMAKFFNCENDEQDWKKIISCLKKVDAIEMISKTKEFTQWLGYPYFVFQPVIEPVHKEAFLVQRPRDVPLNSLDIPLLTGITTAEGLLSTAQLLGNELWLQELKDNVKDKFPLMLAYDHWDMKKQQSITKAFEEFYLKNGHDYHKLNHQNFTDMFSDSLFVAGFDEYLQKRLSVKSAVTFSYVFDFKLKNSLSKFMGGGDFYYGVCHGDDNQIFFPIPPFLGSDPYATENFRTFRDALVEMWVNFAVYGNPTPDNKYPTWNPTTKYPWNYAHLGGVDENGFFILKNSEGYATGRLELWKNLKPHVENDVLFTHSEL